MFDVVIADILDNHKFAQVVTEFSIRGRKLNSSLVLSHNHTVPKNVTLSTVTLFLSRGLQINVNINK